MILLIFPEIFATGCNKEIKLLKQEPTADACSPSTHIGEAFRQTAFTEYLVEESPGKPLDDFFDNFHETNVPER